MINDFTKSRSAPFSERIYMEKDKILNEAIENRIKETFEDIGVDILDYNALREGLFIELINYDRNKSLLKHVPHKRICDLAVVARCSLDIRNEHGSMLVTDIISDLWQVSVDQLIREARENSELLYPIIIDRLESVIEELSPIPVEDLQLPYYYVSNPAYKYGAAAIMYNNALSRIYEIMGGPFYIVPSSVNELLILPGDILMPEEEILDMIREVNDTVLTESEILSYNLYRCERVGSEPVIILDK